MHGNQFLASVALVKALGGGWEGFKEPPPLVRIQDDDAELFGGAQ
jgi:hypothetical protein